MQIVHGVETSSHRRSLNYAMTLPKPVDYIKIDCHVCFLIGYTIDVIILRKKPEKFFWQVNEIRN